MEDNNLHPNITIQSGNFRQTIYLPNSSGERLIKSRFCKAFASLERAEGICQLSIIWERGKQKKNYEAHHYSLRYDYAGIIDYWIEDITCLGVLGWQKRMDSEVVQLGLLEAASLIQDAYAQNMRFKTRTAPGIDNSHMLLQFDTTTVDRAQFSYRLLPGKIDLQMFTNIYLAALKRLDRSLLYDLAAGKRREQLGDRVCYLQDAENELSESTFLRSGITAIESQGRINRVDVYAIISTPAEDIVRINYQLQIMREGNYYCVLDFAEKERETLPPSHPENPLRYQVFATLYSHNCKEKILSWLEKQPGVFLGGELRYGEVFRWLNGGAEPWEEFDLAQAISAEFVVTDNELLVFSQRAESLASIIRLLGEDLRGLLVIQGQYNMEISQLFNMIFSSELRGKLSELALLLQDKRAQSFIILLEPQEKERINTYYSKNAERIVRLGSGAYYYLITKDKLLAELYSMECWLKLTVYNGRWEDELSYLKSTFRVKEIIWDYEMENDFDLFRPPLSEQRKWEISHGLHILSKEANLIKDMGLVPSVREAGQRLGVVI